jgi:hypothetical protein
MSVAAGVPHEAPQERVEVLSRLPQTFTLTQAASRQRASRSGSYRGCGQGAAGDVVFEHGLGPTWVDGCDSGGAGCGVASGYPATFR